ncbi:MAG TPA: GNAT family N-acetyltransferase [Alphaproteobacteria bacterium]|nr:GNAT family N-acetyltransferase [Alphaproteobacteria bacterium]
MTASGKIELRQLGGDDIAEAARCDRTAFAAFLGLPGPDHFRPGADVIGPRLRAWPEASFAITDDGRLAGIALMMRWGSIAIVGPVTIFPEDWGKGHARRLMEALVQCADAAGVETMALITHAQSPTHIRLYEAFGFAMRRITSIMVKPPAKEARLNGCAMIAPTDTVAVTQLVQGARLATDAMYSGLDLGSEIASVAGEGIGEFVVADGGTPGAGGFAICHHGPGSEASTGQYYVKFACVPPGVDAPLRFAELLNACEARAAAVGADVIIAGTSSARTTAYATMKDAGFRTIINCVAMMRPAGDLYNRPDILAIDDWR